MENSFLGSGWNINEMINVDKQISLTNGEEDIKQAIWIILSTKKGERMMYPDFGCGIHEYVFSVINTTNLQLFKHSIEEALVKYEPRIELLNINIDTNKINDGQLQFNIEYKIRETNSISNLVYPFYVNEG